MLKLFDRLSQRLRYGGSCMHALRKDPAAGRRGTMEGGLHERAEHPADGKAVGHLAGSIPDLKA